MNISSSLAAQEFKEANGRAPFSKRYFGGQSVSSNASQTLRRWRLPELKRLRQQQRANHSKTAAPPRLASLFQIEANEEQDSNQMVVVASNDRLAVQAGSMLPLDPKGLYEDSSVQHKAYRTDAETDQQLALQMTKEYNEKMRLHPERLDTWLQFSRLQEKITRLQRGISGNLSSWSKVVVEKEMAVMESALKHHPHDGNLYLHWLRLAIAYQSHEQTQNLWQIAIKNCPTTGELRTSYPLIQRMHFPTSTIPAIRTSYGTEIWSVDRTVAMRKLQRARGLLEINTLEDARKESIMVDLLHDLLLTELAAGYTERAVGLIQAMLELNFNRPVGLVAETTWETLFRNFALFWESESPRIGDLTYANQNCMGWKLWDENGQEILPNPLKEGQRDGGVTTAGTALLEKSGFFDETSQQAAVELPMEIAQPELPDYEEEPEIDSKPAPNPIVEQEVPSIDTSAPIAQSGRKRRMKAADYFRDVIEPEHDLAIKRQGLDLGEDEIAAREDLAQNATAVADDGTVYSVVHGYRIKVTEDDTSMPYKKMLAELRQEKGFQDDVTRLSVEEILALSKKSNASQAALYPLVAIHDTYARWADAETLVSQLQWAPITMSFDEQAADEQPDRVVLLSDIKPVIFPIHTIVARSRLLMRSLQALGVYFGLASPSYEMGMRLGLLSVTDTNETLLAGTFGHVLQSYFGDDLSERHTVDDFQQLAASDSIAAVTLKLLKDHQRVRSLGMFSSLDCIVQCLITIVLDEANGLPLELRCQWAAVCILLIAQGKIAIEDFRTSRPQLASGDEEIRVSTRTILSACDQMLADSPDLVSQPLRPVLYGAYIQAECILGAQKEAFKFCDKTVQTLQRPANIAAIGSVYWHAFRLNIRLPVGMIDSGTSIAMGLGSETLVIERMQTSLSDVVQCAFHLVGSNRDASYQPLLSKKRKAAELGVTEMEAVLVSLRSELSTSIQSFAGYVQNSVDVPSGNDAVDLCFAANASPPCIYLVAMLSWLQYFLELTKLSSSHAPPLSYHQALAAADDTFQHWVTALRRLLPQPRDEAPSEDSVPQLSSQSQLMFGPTDSSDPSVHTNALTEPLLRCVVGLQRLYRWRIELHIAHWRSFGGSTTPLRALLRTAIIEFPCDAGLMSVFVSVESRCPGGYISCQNTFHRLQNRLAWGGGLTPVERIAVLAHECMRIRVEQAQELLEDSRNTSSRLGRLFEKLLEDPIARGMPIIWRLYLRFEVKQERFEEAKRLFYRAIQSCSWCKELWMDAFRRDVLRRAFSPSELGDIRDIMEEKGLCIRLEDIDLTK